MLEKNEQNARESESAFAFAMLLLNVLLLAVTCGTLWLLQSLFTQYSPFNAIVGGDFLP